MLVNPISFRISVSIFWKFTWSLYKYNNYKYLFCSDLIFFEYLWFFFNKFLDFLNKDLSIDHIRFYRLKKKIIINIYYYNPTDDLIGSILKKSLLENKNNNNNRKHTYKKKKKLKFKQSKYKKKNNKLLFLEKKGLLNTLKLKLKYKYNKSLLKNKNKIKVYTCLNFNDLKKSFYIKDLKNNKNIIKKIYFIKKKK